MAAREQAAPGGDNHVAATLNLATVLQDRAEADNDVGLLREAVQLYRDVLPSVDERRHQQVTTNLATALVNVYRFSRDRRVLEEATRDLRRSAVGLPDGTSRLVVLANLGAALHEMFDHTGRIALLDEAVAVQDELLAPPHPRTPERTLNDDRRAADLDDAVSAAHRAVDRTPSGHPDRGMYLANLAVYLSDRYDRTGNLADLDNATAVALDALDETDPDDPGLPGCRTCSRRWTWTGTSGSGGPPTWTAASPRPAPR